MEFHPDPPLAQLGRPGAGQILPFTENLTDRQAAAMTVRAIDWKYALGAELTDTGFGPTVLSRFRTRLADHGLERVVFDRLVEVCADRARSTGSIRPPAS